MKQHGGNKNSSYFWTSNRLQYISYVVFQQSEIALQKIKFWAYGKCTGGHSQQQLHSFCEMETEQMLAFLYVVRTNHTLLLAISVPVKTKANISKSKPEEGTVWFHLHLGVFRNLHSSGLWKSNFISTGFRTAESVQSETRGMFREINKAYIWGKCSFF
jgi:hypothetical protein